MVTAPIVAHSRRKKLQPVSLLCVAIAIAILFIAQVANGTSPIFAALVSLYIVQTFITVSLVGGPSSTIGIMVLVTGIVTVIFSQVLKTLLGQPADTPLYAPLPTLIAVNLTMSGYMSAAFILRSLKMKQWGSLLPTTLPLHKLKSLGYLILVLGITSNISVIVIDASSQYFQTGGLVGVVRTFARILPLGVGIMTAASVLDKKHLLTTPIVIALASSFLFATITATRNMIQAPIIIMVATAFFFRYRFKIHELILIGLILVFHHFVFVPYALYARHFVRAGNLDFRISRSFTLLTQFATDKHRFDGWNEREKALRPEHKRRLVYYPNVEQYSTIDRLSMLPLIDNLISTNLDSDRLGWQSTIWGIQLATPSLLLPNKPIVGANNMLGHKGRDLVGKYDNYTQIAMGVTCDAFLSFGWPGTFLVPLLLGGVFFASYRLVFGQSLFYNAPAVSVLFYAMYQLSQGSISTILSELITQLLLFAVAFTMFHWISNSLQRQTRYDLLASD